MFFRTSTITGVLLTLESLIAFISGSPTTVSSFPTVKLNYGSFQGAQSGNLVHFLGMPFAAPPVGDLRFAPPQPPIAFSGIRQATSFGAGCPQQNLIPAAVLGLNLSAFITPLINSSEDCLFINVVKPIVIPPTKQLPVLFFIYGGGFEEGDTSQNPGDTIVQRSIDLNEPIIYVSANYRVNAFGFLGGKEAKAAGTGNAGLRDQRLALQWVQENIANFGGDRTKVTIWGQSAGAISVGLQMVANDGNPAGLFRAGVMQSGSPLSLPDITDRQWSYDLLVDNVGCTGAKDTLACLRTVPVDRLVEGVNNSPSIFNYTSLDLAWLPSVDGQVFVRNPVASIQKGLYAKVPFITGDCDDEGTLFSLSSLNITTDDQFSTYIATNYLNGITTEQLSALEQAYPQDVSQGSPFNTGAENAPTPEFKRLAAIQGDLVFQAPRRFFLEAASKTQPAYSFLSKRGKETPFLGASHGCDAMEFFGSGSSPDFIGTDALINFVNHMNPNSPINQTSLLSQITWPQWGSAPATPPLLTFMDPAPLLMITTDTYRAAGMKLLSDITLYVNTTF